MSVREKKNRLPESAYRGHKTVSFTACIDKRLRPFASEAIVSGFLSILAEEVQKESCIAPVYCFMPDHLHVLMFGTTPGSRIKRAMDQFKERSGTWFHENRPQFHWQANYHDHIIRHSDDLSNHVRYILTNPVRAGLVEDWNDFPFCGSIGIELGEYLHGLDEGRKFGGRW